MYNVLQKWIKNFRREFTTFSSYKRGSACRQARYQMVTWQAGFTLIELLVVFSIIGVLATVGIVSLGSYGNYQQLQSTYLDVKSTINAARSQTLSQSIPAVCSNNPPNFSGYEVLFCCTGAGCPSCKTTADYELDVVCGGVVRNISGYERKLPKGVTLSTTTRTLKFNTLSGILDTPGAITLTGFGSTQIITVTKTGQIR